MIDVNFTMKFPDGEEISGYVEYDGSNRQRIPEYRHTREFNILTKLIDEEGHYDDTHYVYADDSVTIIINPSPDFTDTLCRESLAVLTDEDLPCNQRTSIGDVIQSIIDNGAICSRINHNTIRCEIAGDMVYWKVCLGDVELTDAFEMSMKRFFCR